MIYVTGDTHGDIDIKKFNTRNFPEQKNLTKNDFVIIAGDFGLVWDNSKREKYWLDWLENKPWTTLWIDGNHENFDLLYQYKEEDWKSGKIRKIRDSIYHLGRGSIFSIEGMNIFTFGGAKSIDRMDRKEGKSWWEQESPTKEEMDLALDNLEKHNMKVDYVITHTTSNRMMIEELYGKENELINNFFDFLETELTYKNWYFGHFHEDREMRDPRHILVYNKIRNVITS